MESTGVYWIPVWNILERPKYGFQLMPVNPATVRALQGCKKDRIDARTAIGPSTASRGCWRP